MSFFFAAHIYLTLCATVNGKFGISHAMRIKILDALDNNIRTISAVDMNGSEPQVDECN